MTRTSANISKGMLFAYLMLGGFILLFLLPTGWTGNLQLLYAHLFRAPLNLGRSLTLDARTIVTAQDPMAQECERLHEANRILENKYANAQALLAAAQERIDELAGLREKNPEWSNMGFVQANVMTDPATGRNELVIDRGEDDGVKKGRYVMADFSVIGVVSAATARTARVQLITDPAGKGIPVHVADSDVRGVLVGRGDGTASIRQVPMKQPVKADDIVLASSVPEALGISIIVGKVTDCKRAKEPLVWDISVGPACDVVNLKSVIVIVPRK